MSKWQIRTLHHAPAMTEDVVEFSGTYTAACDAARDAYRRTGRRSSVVSGMYYWFMVTESGEIDRNR